MDNPLLSGRRSKPLDEDLLDEIAVFIGELPEPLAAVATGVEVARAEADATGVRKRLFELGIAVVRYAVSMGLAAVAAALQGGRVAKPLAEELQRAARMSDGQWCSLARRVQRQLKSVDAPLAAVLDVVRGKALADLVSARNDFVHGGGAGDDAPQKALAVLEEARPLFDLPLRVVTGLDPPSYQDRVGSPLRAGVWRKTRKAVPEGVREGAAYLVVDDERWLCATPWIPEGNRKLLLLDAPHVRGASWRWVDSDTGEHRDAPELDAALKALAGDDASAPVPPCERPKLVGRGTAIGNLRRAAELAGAGAIAVVVLTGPQGIGRGRMLETLREAAPGFGFGQVIEAVCQEHRNALLRPLRRALVGAGPSLASVADAVSRAQAGDAVSGSAGLEAAIEAVEETLLEVSLEEPTLLLLDDAQWADDATLELLSMLTDRATRRARGQLLLVVAVRDEPDAPAALTRFIGQVERDVGAAATRVELGPLDEKESRALVQGVAPLDTKLSQILVAGAAGVPFFIVQAVQAWSETGALAWRDAAWHASEERVLDEPVPGVAQLVKARLASLFEPGGRAERTAAHALTCIGLAGGWLGMADLERAMVELDHAETDVEHALEALLQAGVLIAHRERHECGFAQPMVARAVVEHQRGKPWFRRVHRTLLNTVANDGDADADADFLADGFDSLGEKAQALHWRERAIDYSMARGLFTDAVNHADILERDSTGPQRAAAQLAAADALLRSGNAAEARGRLGRQSGGGGELELRRRILQLDIERELGSAVIDERLVADADAVSSTIGVRARLSVARVARGERGVTLLNDAVSALAADVPGDLEYRVMQLRCELLEERSSLASGEGQEALRAARQAAQACGSQWALLDAENDLAIMESAKGNHDRALEMLADVVAQAKERRFGKLHRTALQNTAAILGRAERWSAAAAAGGAALELLRAAADWRFVSMTQSIRAEALQRMGDLDAAIDAVDEALAIKRDAGASLAVALLRRADILHARGDAAAADAAREALAEATALRSTDHQARARLWLARHADDAEDLGALVAELELQREDLRPATVRMLDAAKPAS